MPNERDSPWRVLRGEIGPIELRGEIGRPAHVMLALGELDFSDKINSALIALFEDI